MEALIFLQHDPGERFLRLVADHCLEPRRRLEGYTPQVSEHSDTAGMDGSRSYI